MDTHKAVLMGTLAGSVLLGAIIFGVNEKIKKQDKEDYFEVSAPIEKVREENRTTTGMLFESVYKKTYITLDGNEYEINSQMLDFEYNKGDVVSVTGKRNTIESISIEK